jgi:hypothetical protein
MLDKPDKRQSQFSRTADRLDTSTIYRLLKAMGQSSDPASTFIWKNAVPPWVQLFTRLLIRGRIQCRTNLYHKKIVDSGLYSMWPQPRKRQSTSCFTALFLVGCRISRKSESSSSESTLHSKTTEHPWWPVQCVHYPLLLATLEKKKRSRLS